MTRLQCQPEAPNSKRICLYIHFSLENVDEGLAMSLLLIFIYAKLSFTPLAILSKYGSSKNKRKERERKKQEQKMRRFY